MTKILYIAIAILILTVLYATNTRKDSAMNMKTNKLTQDEEYVILKKGTEPPFTGKYTDNFEKGTYICRQCNAPLYKSESKFHSGC